MPSIFLGTHPDTRKIERLPLQRHAITVAGSRMGKGACQIIPTLKEWPSSAIVIDPKGEAAINTAAVREKMGQRVAILDPMHIIKNPALDPWRVTFDPLSVVRDGAEGFRDLLMIADGLVLTSGKERDPHWNESALSTIAGCLAYMLETAQKDPETEPPSLARLPALLRQLREPVQKFELVGPMRDCKSFGGLAADTAALFESDTNETASVLSTTSRHTRFLGDSDMAQTLRPANDTTEALDLAGLKTGALTLYVVIHPGALVLHSRFLRLFVRLALSTMMDTEIFSGQAENKGCLFVLDEFYSLGKIAEIQKAAGLMPGYGVHLWPILQDWGQLVDLYDAHGAQTFLANADAVSVFGVSDQTTLREASRWFGEVTADEIRHEALHLADQTELSEAWRKFGPLSAEPGDFIKNQRLAALAALLQGTVGKPRKSPAEIQYHIGKEFNDDVARRMFVFLRTGRILDLIPTPYFSPRGRK